MNEPEQTPIGELMARDPLQLSEIDITRIIEKLRESRKAFVAGNAKAGVPDAKKSKAQKTREQAGKVVGDVDLGDLI